MNCDHCGKTIPADSRDVGALCVHCGGAQTKPALGADLGINAASYEHWRGNEGGDEDVAETLATFFTRTETEWHH